MSTLDEIAKKATAEKEAAGKELDSYIDDRVDKEIESRVKSALPWALALGAGLLVAWAVTRNNREA